MEIFDVIRGNWLGGKVVKAASSITKDAVNFIQSSGSGQLRVGDTYLILREAFCASWTIACLKNPRNSLIIGAALERSLDTLRDWFVHVSGSIDDSITVPEIKSKFTDDFKTESLRWMQALKTSHPELVGADLEVWLPVIGAKMVLAICSSLPDLTGFHLSQFLTGAFIDATKKLH